LNYKYSFALRRHPLNSLASAVFHRSVKDAKHNIPYTANFYTQWSAVTQTSTLKFPVNCVTQV